MVQRGKMAFEQTLLINVNNVDLPTGLKLPDFQTVLLPVEFKKVPSLNYEYLRNEYGAIRQKLVRRAFEDGLLSPPELIELYNEWKDDHEYFILTVEKTILKPNLSDNTVVELKESFYRFVKGAKRGNDVYRYLVKERLAPLKKLKEIIYFKPDALIKKTPMLFITLTCDVKKYDGNVAKAWLSFGKEFHLFKSKLEKEYGKVELFKVYESTENFYPHFHFLVYFKDCSFIAFKHIAKKGKNRGKTTFRISKDHQLKIKGFWGAISDILAVSDTKYALKEMTKYITIEVKSAKGSKTNTMLWSLNRRSFSLSKGFIPAINGEKGKIPPMNDIKDNALLSKTMANCNRKTTKWEFVGILRGKDLGFSGNLWVVDVKKPPPRIKKLIDFEIARQGAKVKKSKKGGFYGEL
jgi:hypothetical protein